MEALLLKCGASQSPNSQCQRFGLSGFSAHTALNPQTLLSLFYSPASTFSNGAHSKGSTRPIPQGLHGRNRIPVGLLAGRLLFFVFLIFPAGTHKSGNPAQTFMTLSHNNIAVGKYLVSPLAKPQGTGGYAASVSIRSGRGSATHDRVMRFNGLFDNAAQALQYATDHALNWIQERTTPVCA